MNHHCDDPDEFDEGVEVSVGNRDRDGYWVPLHYFANTEKSGYDNPPVGPVNSQEQTVNIRGYTVPYTIQNGSKTISMSVYVCGELLRDGVQIRWLQTVTSFITKSSRDRVTLENVSIPHILECNEERYFISLVITLLSLMLHSQVDVGAKKQ